MSTIPQINVTSVYARALRALMVERADYSVLRIAEDLGVSRQTVYAWLRGRKPHPAVREYLFIELVEQIEAQNGLSAYTED